MKKPIPLLFVVLMLFVTACNTSNSRNHEQETTKPTVTKQIPAQPPLVVYKTKADYSKLVPVILSCDKTHIISYPHPKDLEQNGKFRYPTPIGDGYLLDNKGITKDVAFLEYTYEEYHSFCDTPGCDSLYWHIQDIDPLTEFLICGSRNNYDGDTERLLEKIKQGNCANQIKKY